LAIARTHDACLRASRRPHYRPHERLHILWHAARYGLSLDRIANAFLGTRKIAGQLARRATSQNI
jgi:hypothetical protein